MSSTPQRWDSPAFTWDAPGLTWDSAASAARKSKKKPFRRKAKSHSQLPPTPSTTMPTFKYNVAPLSAGGFTTRAARGNLADEAAILAAIAAEAGITPAQAEAAIKGFFNKVLACSAGCDWSPGMFGLISFRPTSGGSESVPTDFHNADNINADVSLSFSAEAIRDWRATLALESLGEVGRVTPVIETVIRQSDLAVDKYTAGDLIQVRGDYMDLDPADANQGVFFKAGAAAEVRATSYAGIEPSSIIVLVPAALSGPLQVRVATFINGSVRSHTYTNLLTTP